MLRTKLTCALIYSSYYKCFTCGINIDTFNRDIIILLTNLLSTDPEMNLVPNI